MGAMSRRIWRTEHGPILRPFMATLAFPSGVRGPVLKRQGRCLSAVCRSFSRPCGVKPLRFARFKRAIIERRLAVIGTVGDMGERLGVQEVEGMDELG